MGAIRIFCNILKKVLLRGSFASPARWGENKTKVKLIWLNEHECVAILYGREIQKVSGNFLLLLRG